MTGPVAAGAPTSLPGPQQVERKGSLADLSADAGAGDSAATLAQTSCSVSHRERKRFQQHNNRRIELVQDIIIICRKQYPTTVLINGFSNITTDESN